jgi:hypothetical protein
MSKKVNIRVGTLDDMGKRFVSTCTASSVVSGCVSDT